MKFVTENESAAMKRSDYCQDMIQFADAGDFKTYLVLSCLTHIEHTASPHLMGFIIHPHRRVWQSHTSILCHATTETHKTYSDTFNCSTKNRIEQFSTWIHEFYVHRWNEYFGNSWQRFSSRNTFLWWRDGECFITNRRWTIERHVNRLNHSLVYRNAKRDQSSNDENNIAIHGYLCRSYDARQRAWCHRTKAIYW